MRNVAEHLPFAKSSSISSSVSLADIDIYKADMEYLLDWRADREPSWEDDMVFCREIGWNEEEDAVEAREGVCNMTDMSCWINSNFVTIFTDPVTRHHDLTLKVATQALESGCNMPDNRQGWIMHNWVTDRWVVRQPQSCDITLDRIGLWELWLRVRI